MKFFKKTLTTILLLTVSSAYAGTKIEVMASFKKDAPLLKTYPLNSEKKAYLKGDDFNNNILSKYGYVDIESNGRISLTKQGEYNRQCVAFVKAVSNAKRAEYWIRGEKLSPLNSFPRFTLVATFSSNGKYPYPENPTPHVGILYQHTPDGIYLLDQNHLDSSYGSSPIGEIAVHFVPFNNNKGPSNASNFYVVEQ